MGGDKRHVDSKEYSCGSQPYTRRFDALDHLFEDKEVGYVSQLAY